MSIVCYNFRTNEIGIFNWVTLETSKRKIRAKLIFVKASTKSDWILIGDL